MASATTKPNPSMEPQPFANRIVPVNSAPPDFDAARDLPAGFLEFLAPLHAALTLRQRALVARRDCALAEAHAGKDRKSTRLNSSHSQISYAVFCLKKKKNNQQTMLQTIDA